MINDEFTGTSQESFWRGQFGDDYSSRNSGPLLISAKIDMFSKALRMSDNTSFLGANIGLNASALKVPFPDITPASRLTRPHFRFYRLRMWMLLTIVPYMNLWISRSS